MWQTTWRGLISVLRHPLLIEVALAALTVLAREARRSRRR